MGGEGRNGMIESEFSELQGMKKVQLDLEIEYQLSLSKYLLHLLV